MAGAPRRTIGPRGRGAGRCSPPDAADLLVRDGGDAAIALARRDRPPGVRFGAALDAFATHAQLGANLDPVTPGRATQLVGKLQELGQPTTTRGPCSTGSPTPSPPG